MAAGIDTSPEGRGLKAIAHGLSILLGADDARKIARASPLDDALHAWCRRKVGDADATG